MHHRLPTQIPIQNPAPPPTLRAHPQPPHRPVRCSWWSVFPRNPRWRGRRRRSQVSENHALACADADDWPGPVSMLSSTSYPTIGVLPPYPPL